MLKGWAEAHPTKGIPVLLHFHHRAVLAFTDRNAVTLQIEINRADLHESAWNVVYGPIVFADIHPGTTLGGDHRHNAEHLAYNVLHNLGWAPLPFEDWTDGPYSTRTLPIQQDPTRSILQLVAERQVRRGVDASGMFDSDTARCHAPAADGSALCNLAWNHDTSGTDYHEYFQPMPGGRTVMVWTKTN